MPKLTTQIKRPRRVIKGSEELLFFLIIIPFSSIKARVYSLIQIKQTDFSAKNQDAWL
jgi:hypothetical protein